MKKLLTIMGSVGLIATTSAAVISCGDKTPQKTPEHNPNEKKEDKNRMDESTEKDKKEEKEKPATDKEELTFEKINNTNLGNFQPDPKKYNSVSQLEIKKKIAEVLKTDYSNLTDLDVNYENKTVKVKFSKFEKTLEFKFTSFLDLGKFKPTGKYNSVSQLEIKKKIAELTKVDISSLAEVNVDYESNTGTSKSSMFYGTLYFKFSLEK
ncbi:lipoprotein [Mycoplasma mycoides]|uniref:lipoprotein n=1 Tax=Mycoplasma mycoides TaxID=2102 RepID=UPI0027377A12|nr:lipoprotein [Mycoplasma mycoides]MDP4040867.1 lipoprotein [Mycoplasma mycoides]MDP4041750.1 lipoprotein [Mycoplasma mycoides]MDP4042630.1 lipoprotein [Mycoplasma mycoides]MDP4044103.1 lipoprotein [Mycoplasma mycoides]MDP4044968.1 lipoprotein [Mycoplasma mycoides]